jgi:hypothetical protein
MKNIGDHINLINDEIISRHRQKQIKIEPISILTRHGAPLVESRYHMPIPRRPMRRRNIREGLSLADMRRASVLQNRIQEGVARLHALRSKLVALESKSTDVLDPLKRMLESRKRKIGSIATPNNLKESREHTHSTPPRGYVPPNQRNNPPGSSQPNQDRQTRPSRPARPIKPSISHDPENPTPRDPHRWEEFERKVLGNPTTSGPDNTISRISNPNNIQDQIIEGEQDGSSATGTDIGESTSSEGRD